MRKLTNMSAGNRKRISSNYSTLNTYVLNGSTLKFEHLKKILRVETSDKGTTSLDTQKVEI